MLAQRLSVTRDTVKQAYKGLIADGTLISRRGLGTFVAPLDQEIDPRAALISAAAKYADTVRSLGVSAEVAAATVLGVIRP